MMRTVMKTVGAMMLSTLLVSSAVTAQALGSYGATTLPGPYGYGTYAGTPEPYNTAPPTHASRAPSGRLCPPRPATAEQQHAIFDDFVKGFYIKGDTEATFRKHVSKKYIQHNPSVLSGLDNALAFFASVGSINVTILNRAFGDNRGVVHSRQGNTAGVDIYRFEGTCIMEHWDVTQKRPAHPKNPLALW